MTPREAEELFLDHLAVIERAIKFAARKSRFPPPDAEDFESWAKLRLITDDYAIVRKFRGKSEFPAFIGVVIQRLAGDYRDHIWRKYRDSTIARRLGDTAIEFERLVRRDGYSIEEAIAHLRENRGVSESSAELRALATQLDLRPRPREVGPETLDTMTTHEDVETRVLDAERRDVKDAVERVLDTALRAISAESLLLLKLYYAKNLSIPAIARHWGVDARPLFRQRLRTLKALREAFIREGLTWEQVSSILGWDTSQDEDSPGDAYEPAGLGQ